MATNEKFVDTFRETEANKKPVKRKRSGLRFYSAKEVDKLLDAETASSQKAQEVAKEHYEDQRLSLLSVSREKAEFAKTNHELEAKIETLLDWKTPMRAEGLEPINGEELFVLRSKADKSDAFEEENERIAREFEVLQKKFDIVDKNRRDFEAVQGVASNMRDQLTDSQNETLSMSGKVQELQNEKQQLLLKVETMKDEQAALTKSCNAKMKMFTDRYQSVISGHAKNLQQLTTTYLDYTKSMEIFSNAVLAETTPKPASAGSAGPAEAPTESSSVTNIPPYALH